MAKRPVEWLGHAETNTVFAPGTVGSVAVIAASVFEDQFVSPTIIRLEGCLNFQLDRTLNNPPTGSQVVAYHAGVIVSHDNLSASNMSPLTEQDLPWLWTCSGRITLPVNYTWNGTTMVLHDAPVPFTQFHHIDSRAMRKVRHDEQLLFVVLPTTITGAVDNLECTWNLRVLCKG